MSERRGELVIADEAMALAKSPFDAIAVEGGHCGGDSVPCL